ncbi:hypothetical protein [Ktedonobacter sp. SOSP1-85]|uniref:hypothetical protein n=1 Tax=Ktedonobacter sp. SOSP1-85 TaxID=2778367 RepID=UPI001914ED6B|nr:hypothetical protein [Ktedonobacter sp. SOSP1-85]
MTQSEVTIQITPESRPSTPSWLAEVTAFAQVLTHTRLLKKIQGQVRFAHALWSLRPDRLLEIRAHPSSGHWMTPRTSSCGSSSLMWSRNSERVNWSGFPASRSGCVCFIERWRSALRCAGWTIYLFTDFSSRVVKPSETAQPPVYSRTRLLPKHPMRMAMA